jgi:hypothetical protein
MAITFALIVNTISLVFAALNLVLLLAILMTITNVAESPRAWTFLTFGLGMIVIHFALNVFIWTNQMFDFYGMHLLSATISVIGFGALFGGVYDVWEVLRND